MTRHERHRPWPSCGPAPWPRWCPTRPSCPPSTGSSRRSSAARRRSAPSCRRSSRPSRAPAPTVRRAAGGSSAGDRRPGRPGLQTAEAGSPSEDGEDLPEGPALHRVASATERLRSRDFTELSPAELRQLVTLMRRADPGHPAAAHPPVPGSRAGKAARPAPDHAPGPALRRRGDPAVPPGPGGAAAPPGRAVRHLRLHGALRPGPAPAHVRALRRPVAGLSRAAAPEPARAVQLRHPADPADPGAGRGQPGHHAGQGGRGRPGLVRRDPDRRRAQGVQRPLRQPAGWPAARWC